MASIGDMRHRVLLQAKNESRDSEGGVISTWANIAEIWASIEPISGRESKYADKVVSLATHTIQIRWQKSFGFLDLTPMRFVAQTGKIYNIESTLEQFLEHHLIVCRCIQSIMPPVGSYSGFSAQWGGSTNGVSGFSGFSGASASGGFGSSGASGYSGGSGFSGFGFSGQSGYSGFAGAQGVTGIQGATGNAGVTGSAGIQGVTGQAGVTGMQGIAGTMGLQGLTGAQGVIGVQGVTGSAGITGIQGTQGVTGQTGMQGSIGVQGTTGIQGIIGVQGTTGTQGIIGTQGVTGIVGLQGIQGQTGAQGIIGSQGLTGIQGVTGIRGTTGINGLQGVQGVTGINGTQGTTGINGLLGLQGFTGAQGTTGIQGIGLQGVTGIQGLTGVWGLTGAQGVTGIQGMTGIQGFTPSTSAGTVLRATTGAPAFAYLIKNASNVASYSILSSDAYTRFRSAGSGTVLTLPSATTAGSGFTIWIQNNDATNPQTIKTASGETINGAVCSSSGLVLSQRYAMVALESDGVSDWAVIECNGDQVQSNVGPVASGSSGVTSIPTTITLSPGEWDITANFLISSGSYTSYSVGISDSGSFGPLADSYTAASFPSATGLVNTCVPNFRYVNTATKTINALALIVYSSAPSVFAKLSARRIR